MIRVKYYRCNPISRSLEPYHCANWLNNITSINKHKRYQSVAMHNSLPDIPDVKYSPTWAQVSRLDFSSMDNAYTSVEMPPYLWYWECQTKPASNDQCQHRILHWVDGHAALIPGTSPKIRHIHVGAALPDQPPSMNHQPTRPRMVPTGRNIRPKHVFCSFFSTFAFFSNKLILGQISSIH